IGQTLEHHDGSAIAADSPSGPGVESPAVAIRRENPAFLVKIALDLRQLDTDAAAEGHVALEIQQGVAGHMQGDERGRAGSIDADAGASQVELVGDSRGQVFLAIGYPDP